MRAVGLAVLIAVLAEGGAAAQDGPPDGDCDPNYAGVCVPIASDVDCAGGGGNGPAYVRGPVRVVGRDIYRLDSDGDGLACEPKR